MNCFYHEEVPAVAPCSSCGKFLCKECATKYTPILCGDCAAELYREQQVQEHKKEMSEDKRFKLAIILGVIDIVANTVLLLANGAFSPLAIVVLVISAFMWAGFPYGWQRLTGLRRKLNFILILPIFGWLMYFAIKAEIALLTGWVFFIKELIKRRKK